MRIQQAIAASIIAPVLVLTACGGDDSGDDSADQPSVTTEMGVTITGEVGEEPTLTIPSDEPTSELQVEVVAEGDGPEVAADDIVVANYLGQTWKPRAADGSELPTDSSTTDDAATESSPDASPGDSSAEDDAQTEPYVFDSSYADQPRGFPLGGVISGWRDGLAGQKVGSRVLIAIPPDLGYGSVEGHDLQNDTLVFVVDIVDAIGSDATASGDPVDGLPEDLPTVTGNEGEPPAVDLSGAAVPEQSDSTLVIAGEGPELADNVVVNMVQASYPDGANRISTWDEQEQPLVLASAQLEGIPGLTEALEGHGVGSRVITRIAAADNPGQDGAPGDALVLVIDIVGTF